ncbi:hypothetical protein SAMN05216229_106122 [Geopseudomonas sagittaria]|uniref:Uncharacterized protein n=1 Tax=Geopseudomonas sagittaria TaxID=1135990 RepID=A0A1I5TI62_9GAMM|nr:hypothetical protein SAMN05216229_106122 [Pseudomonas sagittaria]
MRTSTRTKELRCCSVGQCGTATDEDPCRIARIRALTGLAKTDVPDTARE